MRPITMRSARSRAIAGAMIIAIPSAAVAPAAGSTDTPQGAQVTIAPSARHLRAGQRLQVAVNAGPAHAGQTAWLEQQSPTGLWPVLAVVGLDSAGHAVLLVRPQHSGPLRAAVAPVPPGDSGPNPPAGAVGSGSQSGRGGQRSARVVEPRLVPPSPLATSPTRQLSVAARLELGGRRLGVLAGRDALLRGRLVPAVGGRTVILLGRGEGRWHQLGRARTSSGGRYAFVVPTVSPGVTRLRLRFAGDAQNAPAGKPVGDLDVFEASEASEYGNGDGSMGGALACGGTLQPDTLGVANLSLPCGTMVTLRYGGRQVTVPVVNRGPYVGGRTWDLTVATADALGFSGVGEVFATS